MLCLILCLFGDTGLEPAGLDFALQTVFTESLLTTRHCQLATYQTAT